MKNPLTPFFYADLFTLVTAASTLLKIKEAHLGVIIPPAYNLITTVLFAYLYLTKSKYAWHSLLTAIPIIPIYLINRVLNNPDQGVLNTTNIITCSIWIIMSVVICSFKMKYFKFIDLNTKKS